MRRRHLDNGGNAILTLKFHLDDNGNVDAWRPSDNGWTPLHDDERADALLRVAAAIDAELGQPIVEPDDNDRGDLQRVIAALVRHALRSGDVAAGDHAILCNYLQPARDWPRQ